MEFTHYYRSRSLPTRAAGQKVAPGQTGRTAFRPRISMAHFSAKGFASVNPAPQSPIGTIGPNRTHWQWAATLDFSGTAGPDSPSGRRPRRHCRPAAVRSALERYIYIPFPPALCVFSPRVGYRNVAKVANVTTAGCFQPDPRPAPLSM
jgi:hypothetical protein